MPDLFHIDQSWQEQSWYSTGGTRAKKYLASPDGKYYYFKRSEYKPAKDGKAEKYYRYEFWSEIIAYEIGKMLGFDVLRYDVAIDGDVVGCISGDMIDPAGEDLIQGIQYLQSYDSKFNPESYNGRKEYTFQLIERAIKELTSFAAIGFLNKIIEMFVFDVIIGNTDRHQENWAIINKYYPDEMSGKQEKGVLGQWRFAPIYDSGSSLGRELDDARVEELLLSGDKLLKYVLKGKSEVHWLGKKMSHFDLIQCILILDEYNAGIIYTIKRIQRLFNEAALKNILENIDSKIPDEFNQYKIPGNRKALIMKLITLRIKKLEEILQ